MSNEGSKGIVIITWKDVSNARIQNIISNLYMKNQDAIEGMKYYEVGAESSEIVAGVSTMFENLSKDGNPEKKASRKERSLEAFC